MKSWHIVKCCVILGVFLCGVMSIDVSAQNVPMVIDAELPFRCHYPSDDKELSATLVLRNEDF